MDELRLALRRLLKRPASTLASIATLAARHRCGCRHVVRETPG